MSDRPARWVTWGLDGIAKMLEQYVADGVQFDEDQIKSIRHSQLSIYVSLSWLDHQAAENAAKTSDVVGTTFD